MRAPGHSFNLRSLTFLQYNFLHPASEIALPFHMPTPDRSTPPFHTRLRLSLRLLPLLALSLAAAPLNAALSPAQSEALYQEMLRDPQFKAADKELSALYSAIRRQLPPAGQSQIRDQQREWLKSAYEAIAKTAPSARAGLGERLTRERIQELRLAPQSPRQDRPPSPTPPAQGGELATSPRGEAIDVDASLARLKSKDPDRRLEALRKLEYSLDPRLPAVMLGLLNDAGNTTRRVAAHGVGSRWWQVPTDKLDSFIGRLKTAAAKEGEGYTGECYRGVALLQVAAGKRIEHPEAVSLSPNGRWIIYDRLGMPCLVDVQSRSEELLGLDSDLREGRFWGNPKSVVWHPSKEAAAIPHATRRGTACLLVWTHGSGTRVIHRDSLLELVAKRKFKADPYMSYISEDDLKWRGDKLLVPLEFAEEGGNGPGRVATLSWNPSSGELALEGIK